MNRDTSTLFIYFLKIENEKNGSFIIKVISMVNLISEYIQLLLCLRLFS